MNVGNRWDDVDLERSLIDINHSLTYDQSKSGRVDCTFRFPLIPTIHQP